MLSLKAKFVLIAAIGLAACSPSGKEVTGNFPIMPEGLKDCKIYDLQSDGGSHVRVVRCPNSSTSTSYRVGKATHYTAVVEAPVEVTPPVEVKPTEIVVDGVTYKRSE